MQKNLAITARLKLEPILFLDLLEVVNFCIGHHGDIASLKRLVTSCCLVVNSKSLEAKHQRGRYALQLHVVRASTLDGEQVVPEMAIGETIAALPHLRACDKISENSAHEKIK